MIAEVKRRSPSKGPIAPDLDPAALAGEYQAGGAACLSVLTDADYFSGSAADLVAAGAACTLPVLRKDFTVSAADVCDARLMGADAILLIVAALSDDEVATFLALARELTLDALVEVHDEDELDRALAAGAELVGVNQRDLTTFSVDAGRAARLGGMIPADVVAVAESGIHSAEGRVRSPTPDTRPCSWASPSSRRRPPRRGAGPRRAPRGGTDRGAPGAGRDEVSPCS